MKETKKSNERWHDVKGFEGWYSVSNRGRVRNERTGRIMNPDKNSCGYERVTFGNTRGWHKRYFVHRLVAYHFVKGYRPGLCVNHVDGNKANNVADNLEWVTPSENSRHAFVNNLRRVRIGDELGTYAYVVSDYSTGQIYGTYSCRTLLLKDYPYLNKNCIKHYCQRGWFWRNGDESIGKVGLRRYFVPKSDAKN